jgi:hypothetical protein
MKDKADFYIEKVRYSRDHSHIVWVLAREDKDGKLHPGKNMLRKTMLGLIHAGKMFMTIYRNEEGKYRKGERVTVIQVKGVDYMRTDQDALEAGKMDHDNLANVPEF